MKWLLCPILSPNVILTSQNFEIHEEIKVHCRQWRESTHTTSPKPNTAQKPWNKTMREAESCEAGPPNDQTRTMKIVTPVTHHPPHTHVGPVSEPIISYGYDQMSTCSRLLSGQNGFPW